MQKEHPILFSTPMVQAILAGRKSQTRRVVNPQPIDSVEIDGNLFEGKHKGYVKVDGHTNWQQQFAFEFCRWKVGDLLWVRETWAIEDCGRHVDISAETWLENWPIDRLKFIATDTAPSYSDLGIPHWWNKRPSIFMPKWAARIWLQVDSVRVERLLDIKPADAFAEGINTAGTNGTIPKKDYLEIFKYLWLSIHGIESWDANPWLWVVTFKVLSTTGRPAIAEQEAAAV